MNEETPSQKEARSWQRFSTVVGWTGVPEIEDAAAVMVQHDRRRDPRERLWRSERRSSELCHTRKLRRRR